MHSRGTSPTFVGVITSSVRIPGTASCFCPNWGTKNEWITSRAVMSSTTVSSTGSRSVPERGPVRVLEVPGELLCGHLHAQTHPRSRSRFARSTIALMIAIAVTSTAGIAVQTISIPVWPWIGGPSLSSSGWARNFQTE